jgi:hypothetical protein
LNVCSARAIPDAYGQHPVFKAGLNLIGIDRARQTDSALEGAVGALHEVVVLLLVLALEFLLGPDHKDIVFQPKGEDSAEGSVTLGSRRPKPSQRSKDIAVHREMDAPG